MTELAIEILEADAEAEYQRQLDRTDVPAQLVALRPPDLDDETAAAYDEMVAEWDEHHRWLRPSDRLALATLARQIAGAYVRSSLFREVGSVQSRHWDAHYRYCMKAAEEIKTRHYLDTQEVVREVLHDVWQVFSQAVKPLSAKEQRQVSEAFLRPLMEMMEI